MRMRARRRARAALVLDLGTLALVAARRVGLVFVERISTCSRVAVLIMDALRARAPRGMPTVRQCLVRLLILCCVLNLLLRFLRVVHLQQFLA